MFELHYSVDLNKLNDDDDNAAGVKTTLCQLFIDIVDHTLELVVVVWHRCE